MKHLVHVPGSYDETVMFAFLADLRDGADADKVRRAIFQPSTIRAFEEAHARFTEERSHANAKAGKEASKKGDG